MKNYFISFIKESIMDKKQSYGWIVLNLWWLITNTNDVNAAVEEINKALWIWYKVFTILSINWLDVIK